MEPDQSSNKAPDAAESARRRRVEGLQESGVHIEDPASIHVGEDVVLEPGARVRPFTILEGRTVVRREAVVGPFVRLNDVEVGRGAEIRDHSLLTACQVGEGAVVGPFAHVRPDSRIGARARVGNFVELKKATLGDHAKASHLAYLGDASVGDEANIGAGTITCNYDGQNKHVTRIGAGTFIGSNSCLVAPVTVGDGAYVAAGSTVTEDVPADALALGRARQVTKPQWAKHRREGKAPRHKG